MGVVVHFPTKKPAERWRLFYRRAGQNLPGGDFDSPEIAKRIVGGRDTRWVWAEDRGRSFWITADGHFSIERGPFHHEQIQGRSALD